MKTAMALGLVAALRIGSACSCAAPSVAEAKKYADVVFRGVITEIKDQTVFFHVSRKWKGQVSRTFTMPEFRETSACLGFWPSLLDVGNELLVYAQWLPPKSEPKSEGGAYFTSICTRTRLAKDAREDFSKLGPGSSPSK